MARRSAGGTPTRLSRTVRPGAASIGASEDTASTAHPAASAELTPVWVVADPGRELVPQQATFAPSRRPARTLAAPAASPSTSSTRTCGQHTESTHRTPLLDGQTLPAGALVLVGRHRFSTYALILRLEPAGPGGSHPARRDPGTVSRSGRRALPAAADRHGRARGRHAAPAVGGRSPSGMRRRLSHVGDPDENLRSSGDRTSTDFVRSTNGSPAIRSSTRSKWRMSEAKTWTTASASPVTVDAATTSW